MQVSESNHCSDLPDIASQVVSILASCSGVSRFKSDLRHQL